MGHPTLVFESSPAIAHINFYALPGLIGDLANAEMNLALFHFAQPVRPLRKITLESIWGIFQR